MTQAVHGLWWWLLLRNQLGPPVLVLLFYQYQHALPQCSVKNSVQQLQAAFNQAHTCYLGVVAMNVS
jgi:hypothetical protein